MPNEFVNWLAMIEIPIFAGLFRLLMKNKKEADTGLRLQQDVLSEFKLYAARNYVSIACLKDVENRLTEHLLRIEDKLDKRSFANDN